MPKDLVCCVPRVTIRFPGLFFAGLALAVGCTAPHSSEIAQRKDKSVCANSLTTKQLEYNLLIANSTNLPLLLSNPLATDTFQHPFGSLRPLYLAIGHDWARGFLKYLVRCALGRDQQPVFIQNPFPPNDQHTWPGGLGLCREWATGGVPVNSACLERVSGCILALNNPAANRVELGLLGHDPDDPVAPTLPLQATMATDTHFPLMDFTVDSFNGCAPQQSGHLRNCGWSADFVGQCQTFQRVSVSAGAPPSDDCTADPIGSVGADPMVLRVCDGISGCNSGTLRELGSSPPGLCGYAGPGVSFNCPSSGYFSVMVGPWLSGGPGTAGPAAVSVAVSDLPATEKEIFAIREGGFFGNIFHMRNEELFDVTIDENSGYVFGTDQTLYQEQGAVFKDMWSCFDNEWPARQTYMDARICADEFPNRDCAATTTGPCWVTSAADSQCDIENDDPGDFEHCRDGNGVTRTSVITSHLNQPCDELRPQDGELCRRQGGPGGPGMVSASPEVLSNGTTIVHLDGPIAFDDGSCPDTQ